MKHLRDDQAAQLRQLAFITHNKQGTRRTDITIGNKLAADGMQASQPQKLSATEALLPLKRQQREGHKTPSGGQVQGYWRAHTVFGGGLLSICQGWPIHVAN